MSKLRVDFLDKVIEFKLENGTQLKVAPSNGSILSINEIKVESKITSVRILAGEHKGKYLWFDFLYLLISDLLNAGSILQRSFRPNVYLIGEKSCEKSAVIGFHLAGSN